VKCERCGSGLGNVVPRISLEAAEADAVRFRDLYGVRSEFCETLEEQLSAADAEGNRMEARIHELEAEIARLKTPECVLGACEAMLRERWICSIHFSGDSVAVYSRRPVGACFGGATLAEAFAKLREVE
jgi:hypothetical protein